MTPKKKKTTRKRQYVSIPQGEGHYDRVEVKCKARRAIHDGTPPCICVPAKKPKRESYKSANAANKAKRKAPTEPRTPDHEQCDLCGLWCVDVAEISRPHAATYPRNPDNHGTTQKSPPWLYNAVTGLPWEHVHESTGTSRCNACIVDDSAPREGGLPWMEFTQELISKLGYLPRYPGLTDEEHLRELIGPDWAADAKQKWVVNWTVDGWLAYRPHLKAKPRERTLLAGSECPQGKRWSVNVNERGVHFNVDHQGFMLADNYDPEDGWTKQAYYKWYANQLTNAFRRLLGEF